MSFNGAATLSSRKLRNADQVRFDNYWLQRSRDFIVAEIDADLSIDPASDGFNGAATLSSRKFRYIGDGTNKLELLQRSRDFIVAEILK